MLKIENKSSDKILLFLFLILAPLISLTFKTNLLTSVFLFYILPSLWLSFRNPKYIKKAALFSLIGTVLFFIIDYVAVTDQSWWVSSIFQYRFLSILPIEDSLWFFMGCYLVVMFYEHFDESKHDLSQKNNLSYLIGIVTLLVLVFILLLIYFPNLLSIRYAYLWIGVFFIFTPVIAVFLIYPKLRFKFLKTNLYMFLIQFPFEIVALKTGQWSFPGNNFIGWIKLFDLRFPLEEFIIFISMTGVTILAYYEFFDDDRK